MSEFRAGVQMLDDAHTLWSRLHDAQARMEFELARRQHANAQKETKTKREIVKDHNFASKRMSLSTFWTRKLQFEVLRQTCSGTISGQFRNNKIKTKIAFSTKTTNFRISEILYYTLHFIRDSLLHQRTIQRQ